MGCFGHRRRPKGRYDNPAYSFNNPPPAHPASGYPAPTDAYPASIDAYPTSTTAYPASTDAFNPSTFRPEGLIPDGKGALPTYDPSAPTSSAPPSKFVPPSTADLPPPAFFNDTSPASNTTSSLADRGYDFCMANPLLPPQPFPASALSAISSGIIHLAPPPHNFAGVISATSRGLPYVATRPRCPDTTLLSALPLYCANYHQPTITGRKRHHIFFSLTLDILPADAVVALGFAACPYPGFRMPGWNRGSVGVHSDDGRRYCNDSYGGKDLTAPFVQGETVGMGMEFRGDVVEVYVLRGEREVGRWRLDEETDAHLEWGDAADGLLGDRDVYAAVGLWGGGIRVGVERWVSE